MRNFSLCVVKRFNVSKYIINRPILFNELRIEQEKEGYIKMNMKAYMDSVTQIDLSKSSRKQKDEK